MDVDPPTLEASNPTGDTSTTDLLGEEPVLNRDNPPEAADTLEDILDAVTALPEEPAAKITSESLVENIEQSVTNAAGPEEIPASEPNTDDTNTNENVDNAIGEQAVDDTHGEQITGNAANEPDKDNASGETNVNNGVEEPETDNTPNENTLDNVPNEQNVDNTTNVPAMDTALNEQTGDNAPNEQNVDNTTNVPAMDTALNEQTGDNAPNELNGVNVASEQNEAMDTSDQMTETNEKVAADKPLTDNVESERPATTVDASPVKPVAPAFNLGVPGLKFSANNVKTAKDGTKMVQIHQSQITPEQLVALQNNPNIKVVFRHVPSGKSYSRAPRHLLPPGYSPPSKKRKADDDYDGDVYKFDEGEDLQAPNKTPKYDPRFKFNHGSAKKKGKQRVMPDSSPYASNYMSANHQGGLPTQVMLTDLLARINHPNAKKEIKIHTSQINAEVLANLELHPYYKLVLTTKQELPPLVIENVDAEEQAKLEKDAEEIEKKETAEKEEDEKMETEQESEEKVASPEQEQNEETEEEKERRVKQYHQQLEEEEKRKKEREAEIAKKMAEEEEELKKSIMQTKRSRSGRIRKPSKYALDIARLTKRKSSGIGGGESSGDESEDKFIKPTKKADDHKGVISPPRNRGQSKNVLTPQPSTQPKQTDKTLEEDDEKKIEDKASDEKQVETETKQTAVDSEKAAEPKKAETDEKDVEKEKVEDDSKTEQSEKEVTSTENMDVDKSKENSTDQIKDASENNEDKNNIEPDNSTESNAQEDKGDKQSEPAPTDPPADSLVIDEISPDIEEPDENEVIDNKYRLRKLLEQCSTEEIRSVLLPEAFDSINIGDFLLYKAGQMHNPEGKISFPKLYKELEALHNDATKEASRYNTLVRRANKVGGDKRMEKIVLMPVYNIDAANSLQISNSSIDAHICGIQRTITTEMIAANSFFIKSKMDSPLIRLKLPEATAPKYSKPKQTKPLYTNQHQQPFANIRQEPDSTTPDKPKTYRKPTYGQKIASMKYSALQTKNQMDGLQVRRPSYIDQLKSTGQITLGGMSHQLSTKSTNAIQSIPVDTSLLRADVQSAQVAASATSALAQMQAAVQQEQQQQQAVVSTSQNVSETMALNPVTGELMSITDAASTGDNANIAEQTEQYFVTEDGVPITTSTTEASDGEVRKHLVPIGDGQYVELPEGYSLIQTDEGYIIGQPGSTFTQGEDGNVYITNSDGTTTEITREDIAGAGEDTAVVTQETEG